MGGKKNVVSPSCVFIDMNGRSQRVNRVAAEKESRN